MYFTLTSVLSYFEGFKLALFNVIFLPNFGEVLVSGLENQEKEVFPRKKENFPF